MLHFLRRLTLALVAGLSLAACGDVLSPGRPSDQAPAQLALNLTLPRLQSALTSEYAIEVQSAYALADGGEIALTSVTVPLADELRTQQVPVSVELARCLADESRVGATTDPGACTVRLTIALRRGTTTLDQFVLNSVRLVPGESTALPQSVELFEVASVFISLAPGSEPVPPLQTLTVGSSAAYLANARSATGETVTGRTTTWSSSDPGVMSVLSSGVVNALAPGTARITATVGGRSASMDVVVIPPAQRLTVAAVPGTGVGTVISVPAGIECTIARGVATGTCAFDFAFGTEVQLRASPASGSASFSGWTGACVTAGSGSQCTLAMTDSRTAGAGFVGLSTVIIAPNAVGGLRIASLPSGLECTLNSGGSTAGVCSATFAIGDTVALEAVELSLTRLQGWRGCDITEALGCQLVITETARIVNVDVDPPTLLSATPAGNGSGLVSAPGFAGTPDLSCGAPPSLGAGRCSAPYPSGSSVVVTATASAGSRFDRWQSSGPCDQSTAPTCLVQFSGQSSENLVARFALEVAPVTLNLTGSGGGRLFLDGELVCELSAAQSSNQCVIEPPIGASLVLTATPLGSGQFLGFGGDCAAGVLCELTVTGPRTVLATFTSEPPSATVTVGPVAGQSGRGLVVSGDQAIQCSVTGAASTGTCSISRPIGSTISLVAQDIASEQGPFDVFLRWGPASPCPNSPEPVCTFVLGAGGAEAGATYGPGVRLTVSLGVSAESNPVLAVEANVEGYRTLAPCVYNPQSEDNVCRFPLPTGSTVRLDARTRTGLALELSEFEVCSWTGSSTDAFCTFGMSGDVEGAIYAVSASQSALVTVGPFSGQEGQGRVGSSDETIDCVISGPESTGSCSMSRTVGETITLFAEDSYSGEDLVDVFTRWGPASPCPNSPEPECSFVLGAGGADARASYAAGAQLTVFLDSPEFFEPFVAVEVFSTGYRTLDRCEYADSIGGIVCEFAMPRGPTVRIEAETRDGLTLDLSMFPACSWSGSATSAFCELNLLSDLSGSISASAPFSETASYHAAAAAGREHAFNDRRQLGVSASRTAE